METREKNLFSQKRNRSSEWRVARRSPHLRTERPDAIQRRAGGPLLFSHRRAHHFFRKPLSLGPPTPGGRSNTPLRSETFWGETQPESPPPLLPSLHSFDVCAPSYLFIFYRPHTPNIARISIRPPPCLPKNFSCGIHEPHDLILVCRWGCWI